ncbi:MAG: 3-hydroxyacyl-CoA dehydrogenase family protein [Gammaproteobacteria bacterium]|nr:3-hydroxyacyl-CoA dehydrogenase family protein [Gammaproteobacteria bacterium]
MAIIGAGLMGGALAHLFSAAGWNVRVSDPLPAALERLPERLAALRGAQPRAAGAPPPGHVTALAQLEPAVAGVELVIEAAPEKPPLKQSIFADLARLTDARTLLATNSSVIPVATVTERVDDANARRVIGTHFWNPAELIPLVEVIQGPRSDVAAVTRTMAILRSIGKQPVHVHRDVVPGNRLQHALWREAMALVDEGVCSPEDVDAIIKNSFGLRLAVLGPLENADLVGLELTADIHKVVLPLLSRATAPAPALLARLASGARGVASGAGFYTGWTEERVAALRRRLVEHVAALLGRRG